jgi:hypothetical protein
VAKNRQGLILIIDNNTTNGTYLTTFCMELGGPRWQTKWLRIYEGQMSGDAVVSPEEIEYPVYSIADAASYLDKKLGEMPDVIVFYNAQLGLFQRSAANAEKSEITEKLREFVSEDRRILINLYAANFPVQKVAAHIDPEFERRPDYAKVICRHSVNDAPPSKVKRIVAETLDEWDQRFTQLAKKRVSR